MLPDTSSRDKRPLAEGDSSSPRRQDRVAETSPQVPSVQVEDSQPGEQYQGLIQRAESLRRTSENSATSESGNTLATFEDAAKFGLVALIDTVYEFESRRAHQFAQTHDLASWRRIGVPFLAAIPNKLLSCLINGDIAKEWASGDRELGELFGEPEEDNTLFEEQSSSSIGPSSTHWQDNGNRVAPGHYVRVFVNRKGDPPTPAELHLAIDALRMYIERAPYRNVKLCYDIDNVKRSRSTEEHIKSGNHFFLSPGSGKRRVRNHERVLQVLQFCNAVHSRINQVELEQLQLPDVRPLAYVGYARTISERIASHEDGEASSFLMQLLENTFQFLGFSYRFETFITSFATSADEAKFGEIIINALAQAYHDTGFGVAVHPAGKNCSSAEFSGQTWPEVQKIWEQTVTFRHRVTPFKANMRHELRPQGTNDKSAQVQQRKENLLETIQVTQQETSSTQSELTQLRQMEFGQHPRMPEFLRRHAEAEVAKVARDLPKWKKEFAEIQQTLEKYKDDLSPPDN